jgi:predicted O-methyltransferase YrrM
MQITPSFGKLLWLLARSVSARAILEVGTLGGYSAIWMARALPPGGRLVTLEGNPRHAGVARANLATAGLADVVEVREGPALSSLAALSEEGAGPFDLVFLDADKVNHPQYLEWSLRLTRPGSLIVADNVVRGGAVADVRTADPDIRGVRRQLEMMGSDSRLSSTAVQTVGTKGYDGFAIAIVTG